MSTSESKLTCLCGAVSEPGDLLTASHFPISTGLCNCNACRYSIGTMGCSSIPLKSAPSDRSLAACSSYSTSERMTRYFCKTCGTKAFFHLQRETSSIWAILPGIIDRLDQEDVDTIRVNQTWFVSDVKDGGLARRIMDNVINKAPGCADKERFRFYAGGRQDAPSVPFDQVEQLWIGQQEPLDTSKRTEDDKALVSCHCAGVQLMLLRPDPIRNDLTSVQKHLSQDNTKYIAKFCTCRSCRLATGLPLQPWTYIMPENILTKDGEQVDFDFNDGLKKLPGLTIFRSTKNVRRSFCRTCGATVFFERTTRPEVIDISMGLLRSPAGAMASDFIEWNWHDVGHRGECRDEKYLQMFTGPPKQKL